MKWKFWKKEPPSQKTILQVSIGNLTQGQTIYVEAQSPEKALELFKELRKEMKGASN